MYFVSCFLTVTSLLAFATFNFCLDEVELEKPVSVGLRWSSLAAAGILVFAVQLGVQTLPMLLSGIKISSRNMVDFFPILVPIFNSKQEIIGTKQRC